MSKDTKIFILLAFIGYPAMVISCYLLTVFFIVRLDPEFGTVGKNFLRIGLVVIYFGLVVWAFVAFIVRKPSENRRITSDNETIVLSVSTSEDDRVLHAKRKTISLIILTIIAGVHILLNLLIVLLAAIAPEGYGIGLLTGSVGVIIYIMFFLGLINRQEWARRGLIFVAYFVIIAYLGDVVFTISITPKSFIYPGLNALTIVFAHWPTVRETTKRSTLWLPALWFFQRRRKP